jgi:hypothetical protein
MRSPALFTMILVGVATTASAQPRQEEPTGRVSHNESQKDPKRDAQRQSGEWVELGDPSPAKFGTVYVMVGGEDAGLFGKLRLEATTGKVVVKQVRVMFADGKSKTYKVGKTLDTKRKQSSTTIVDLGDARAIDQVVITTDRRGGEYALHGATSGGIVAER